ncbi:MAG TPA: amidohydrolase family protein [Pyrinomonadaceae bacterium]|jgi:imidazolonepropionase-like amidohydrolase|nr:amidohydrolase family protein [Pyrinomonadaceae bacterium]
MNIIWGSFRAALIVSLLCGATLSQTRRGAAARTPARRQVKEVNRVAAADPNHTVAIVGATLIDGRGGSTVKDSVVVVRGDRIVAAGARASVRVPAGAEMFDARGMTLLPGLIDAHFHIDGDDPLPALYLSHGVTSLRDPGQWIEAYDAARAAAAPVPRLFLMGPHFDSPPAAYPADSYIVRDADEVRAGVERFAAQGASGFKVYFRLPVGLIRVLCEEAHARGLPVTSHLEIVDAGDAIRAGVDGVEHVTSFGTALTPTREAEKYRQRVLADNNARREGRYEVWDKIDLDSESARAVFRLIVERGTFISPTLAVFERQKGDKETNEMHVRAFKRMEEFVLRAKRAGAHVVVGSHSDVPHAERGWAYQRELELFVEAGLTPMEAIVAGTWENAHFFHIEDRLGSVEAGKLADLLFVEGDPLANISNMRNVRRVMLGGRWIGAATPEAVR